VLEHRFISSLLPENPAPLRASVLSSISLYSTRVFIHDATLDPPKVPAYIDGHFSFVIDLDQHAIRIPLIVADDRPRPIPPVALRFHGKTTEESQAAQEYVFEQAPRTGRQVQFSAFISVLNREPPTSGIIQAFRNALLSLDLSFATAVCGLASEPDDLIINRFVFKLFTVDGRLDHFLRCLSISVSQAVTGFVVLQIPELFAITNLFLAESVRWAYEMKDEVEGRSCEQVTEKICEDIAGEVLAPEAIYVLRCLLVIAAYVDGGPTAITLFLDVVAKPFMKGELAERFEFFRDAIWRNDPQVKETRAIIENAIRKVLEKDVAIGIPGTDLAEETYEILAFIVDNLDRFIKLVIYLNRRGKRDHPLVRMISFCYQKSLELGSIGGEPRSGLTGTGSPYATFGH
jgi:hypothetical protein